MNYEMPEVWVLNVELESMVKYILKSSYFSDIYHLE